MKNLVKNTALAVVVSCALANVAQAGQTLTASSWVGPTHIFTVNEYTNFAKDVEKASNGELKFDLHVAGSLLPPKVALEGVRDGVAQVGNLIAAYTPSDLPRNNVINDAAFVVENSMAAAFAVTELHFNNPNLQKEWLEQNVVYGGGFATPMYRFACVPAIENLADLKGKKIRTAGGSHVDWVKSVGGVPVSVPFTDVYTGLERGSIDCVMLDATNLGSGFKIWEVAKSVTMLPMGSHLSGASWIYNRDTWNSLSEDNKTTLMEQMAIANVKRQLDYNAQEKQALKGSWERGLKNIVPADDLVQALEKFKETYISNLPEVSEQKRKVPAVEAKSLIKEFLEKYKRWDKLVNDAGLENEDALIKLVKTEIYDKIDVAQYGK